MRSVWFRKQERERSVSDECINFLLYREKLPHSSLKQQRSVRSQVRYPGSNWFLRSRFYKGKIKVSASLGSDQEVLGRIISKVARVSSVL